MTLEYPYSFEISRDAIIARNWTMDAFANLTGFAPAEMSARGWEFLLHPDDRSLLGARIVTLTRGQPDVQEWRALTKSGETLWLRDFCYPLPDDEQSSSIRVFGAVQDITHSKRAEDHSRQLHADLARFGLLSTMGEMASALAHELNQPLTAIFNYTRACLRMMRSGTEDRAEVLHAIEQTAVQAERAAEVIRQLRRSIARREPHRAAVNLNDLVGEAASLDETELKSNSIRLRLDLALELPSVQADRIQIEQVILNLMRNAIEAMASTEAAARELTIRTTALAGATVEIAVSDTGCGLRPHVVEHLFEPFNTSKPGGMGLGLAISRSIIVKHGGQLRVEPNADQGTKFCFTLPAQAGGRDDVSATDRLHCGR